MSDAPGHHLRREPRPATRALLEHVEAGTISPEDALRCCLTYMSEAEVADMCHINDLLPEPDEEE